MREPFPRRRIRHSVDILSVKSSDFAIVASVIHGESRAPSVGQLVSRSQIARSISNNNMQRVDESACDEPFETYVGWFREGILNLQSIMARPQQQPAPIMKPMKLELVLWVQVRDTAGLT